MAFDTVFARYADRGHLGDRRLAAFVAGDDAGARKSVLALAGEIGFELPHG